MAQNHSSYHKIGQFYKGRGVGGKENVECCCISFVYLDGNYSINFWVSLFTSVQLLNMPTAGSRNLVKHLNQDEEQSKCFSTSIFRSFLFPFLFFLPQVLTDKMV